MTQPERAPEFRDPNPTRSSGLHAIEQLSASQYQTRFAVAARRHGGAVRHLQNGSCVTTIGKSSERRLGLMSGLHGDERSGPTALLHWVESTPVGKLSAEGIELWIAPLINDRGWDENTREWGATNLNRAFLPELAPPFLEQLMADLAEHRPSIYLDLHEDSTKEFAYVYRYREDRHDLSRRLQEVLSAEDMEWTSQDMATWKGSSEVFVRKLGCDLATTLETPPVWPLARRVDWFLESIRFCLGAFPSIAAPVENEPNGDRQHN